MFHTARVTRCVQISTMQRATQPARNRPERRCAPERLTPDNADSLLRYRKFAVRDGVTVYGHGASPCYRRVVCMLEELSVPYRAVRCAIVCVCGVRVCVRAEWVLCWNE